MAEAKRGWGVRGGDMRRQRGGARAGPIQLPVRKENAPKKVEMEQCAQYTDQRHSIVWKSLLLHSVFAHRTLERDCRRQEEADAVEHGHNFPEELHIIASIQ